MTFSELCALIDERIESDVRLSGAVHESDAETSRWTLNAQSVTIRAVGSTGLAVEYWNGESMVHSRTFAASPLMVDRIVTTIAEHLTAYALHRM